MGNHGGERIVEVLERQGVRFVFTLCGGHVSPILVAARDRGLRVVDVRHEATAVFAADAAARLSGTPGVAVVTAGPGLTNTVTAMKNAQLAESPVVVLGGATATELRGRGSLQDIDQLAVVAPHVKWSARVGRVRDLAPAVERAFAVARSGVPGPVFVECPVDALYPETVVREWYGAAAGSGLRARVVARYLARRLDRLFAGGPAGRLPRAPREEVISIDAAIVGRVAKRLRRARRPVLVVGSQALAEPTTASAVADAVHRLGLPTYLSGMARGLLGRDHPAQLRHRRRKALREADLVLLAGVPCDFRLGYGRHIGRRAALVAVNLDGAALRRNRRPTVAVRGAPGRFLCRLAGEGVDPTAWGDWYETLRRRDVERDAEIRDLTEEDAEGGINPLAVAKAIDAVAADDAVLVADGGDFVATCSYVVRPRAPLSWLDPGVFGTLGVGAGFALGTALCRPQSEVWILFGDGAFGYSLAEIDTFVRHRVPVVAVVGNDAGWAQIARDQVDILGDDVATVLRRTAYHDAAAGLGGFGLEVRDRDQLPAVLRQARAEARSGQPVVVNVHLGESDFRKGSISI